MTSGLTMLDQIRKGFFIRHFSDVEKDLLKWLVCMSSPDENVSDTNEKWLTIKKKLLNYK